MPDTLVRNLLTMISGARIEFLGLPGSGKSSIARLAVAALESSAVVHSRMHLLADDMPFLRRHFQRLCVIVPTFLRKPVAFLQAASRILSVRQDSWTEYPKLIWNFWAVLALYQYHHRHQGSALIVDQGVVQAIWSTHLASSTRPNLDHWRPLLSKLEIGPIHFVLVQAEPATARERVLKRRRPGTRLARYALDGPDNHWTRAEKDLALALEIVQQAFPDSSVIAVRSDSGETEIELTERILREISNRNVS